MECAIRILTWGRQLPELRTACSDIVMAVMAVEIAAEIAAASAAARVVTVRWQRLRRGGKNVRIISQHVHTTASCLHIGTHVLRYES